MDSSFKEPEPILENESSMFRNIHFMLYFYRSRYMKFLVSSEKDLN